LTEEAFDQLRTKEQLGYIVFTGMKKIAQNMAAIHFIVQSNHKDALYLDERIETFLKTYYENTLLTMEQEKLTNFINAVKEKLLEKPKNLDEVRISLCFFLFLLTFFLVYFSPST
jgi:insulysin